MKWIVTTSHEQFEVTASDRREAAANARKKAKWGLLIKGIRPA